MILFGLGDDQASLSSISIPVSCCISLFGCYLQMTVVSPSTENLLQALSSYKHGLHIFLKCRKIFQFVVTFFPPPPETSNSLLNRATELCATHMPCLSSVAIAGGGICVCTVWQEQLVRPRLRGGH